MIHGVLVEDVNNQDYRPPIEMTSSAAKSPDTGSWTPAAYGQACMGCSRAKCKCFYRRREAACERCQRLSIACTPAAGVRKRKVRGSPQPPPMTNNSRLEEKLDNIVSLLRYGGATHGGPTPPTSLPSCPASSSSTSNSPLVFSNNLVSSENNCPDIAIAGAEGTIDLLRPGDNEDTSALIFRDVSVHTIADAVAEEQLSVFKQSFLPMFPVIHSPTYLTAAEFRKQKPFSWLVIMALTSKHASVQFEMESTIWKVISQRIMCQHLASLDLLLGVICFAAWSHYFKQDKPFMTKLLHLATSLVAELGIQREAQTSLPRRITSGRYIVEQAPALKERTLEERRTVLALFYLTSSASTAYRQVEPMHWTPYIDRYLAAVEAGQETDFDILLGIQIKCQHITNQLNQAGDIMGQPAEPPSTAFLTLLMRQLDHVKVSAPSQVQSNRITQLYIKHAELTIRKFFVMHQAPTPLANTGFGQIQRLQHFENALQSAEQWLSLFSDFPVGDWVGLSVDVFAQYLHCLVVLFKFSQMGDLSAEEEELKRRIDVLAILDQGCQILEKIPPALGLIDCEGPRSGLFFKAPLLLKAIKLLFQTEMQLASSQTDSLPDINFTPESDFLSNEELGISDEFLQSLSREPWLSDLFGSSWDTGF